MSESARALSRDERIDWIRLSRTEHVGPFTFYELLRRYGSADAALHALPDLARRGGRVRPVRALSRESAIEELEEAESLGVAMIAYGEAAYPPRLAQLPDAPPILYVAGKGALLHEPLLAIVGARNASANGVKFTREIVQGLARQGIRIASGFARGIDTSAHWASLDSGTAAVMAGGIDVIYPPQNEELYVRIVEQGVAVSEVKLGVQPTARHFPRRNRLISGLALGVLVVEAAPRSGSLITARLALEQGREVFAVPGSPLDPRARGANDLIRHGAVLTEDASDVLAVLRPQLEQPRKPPPAPHLAEDALPPADVGELGSARDQVFTLLGPAPSAIDEIVRQSGLTPEVVLTILLELEMAGRLDRLPGNRVATH